MNPRPTNLWNSWTGFSPLKLKKTLSFTCNFMSPTKTKSSPQAIVCKTWPPFLQASKCNYKFIILNPWKITWPQKKIFLSKLMRNIKSSAGVVSQAKAVSWLFCWDPYLHSFASQPESPLKGTNFSQKVAPGCTTTTQYEIKESKGLKLMEIFQFESVKY